MSRSLAKPCTCVNGGVCISHDIQICECPMGFTGSRCEEVYFDFAYDDSKTENNLHIIVIVTLTLSVFAITTLFCFFTWRRIKSIRRRRDVMKKHRSRRQSRVTIEGSSHPGFGLWETESDRYNSNSLESIIRTEKNGDCKTFLEPRQKDNSVKVIVGI